MIFKQWDKNLGIYPSATNLALYGATGAVIFIVAVSSTLWSCAGSEWAGTILLLWIATLCLFLVLALCGFGIFVLAAFRRQWGACIHALLAFGFIWVMFSPAASIGDLVHLAVDYPKYKKSIETEPTRNIFRFPWGDHAVWVTDGFKDETLVYDRSQSIAANVEKTRPSVERGFVIYTRHLWGNFFVETESND